MKNSMSIPKILDLKTYRDTTKKRKGFTMVELVMVLGVIIALGAIALFSYAQVQHMSRMAQMTSDMEAIANGCLAYQALNITSTPPDTLADLVTGLTANESLDGIAHTDFVTSTKAPDGNYLDPWGNAYTYDSAARSISCTPNDLTGTAMEPVTRTF